MSTVEVGSDVVFDTEINGREYEIHGRLIDVAPALGGSDDHLAVIQYQVVTPQEVGEALIETFTALIPFDQVRAA